jgi:hypothetical protein
MRRDIHPAAAGRIIQLAGVNLLHINNSAECAMAAPAGFMVG